MPDTAPFEWFRADPKALNDAFQASQATSTTPPPNWSDYAENVGERLASWLGEATRPFANVLGPNFQFWLQWAVLALLAALLVMIVVRIIQAFSTGPQTLHLATPKRLPRSRDLTASQHRLAAMRHLEEGDLRLALTSIWWWFAASALNDQPGGGMTTREVLSRSQRIDLRTQAQTLDRLRFGPSVPAESEVRQLFAGFEAAL